MDIFRHSQAPLLSINVISYQALASFAIERVQIERNCALFHCARLRCDEWKLGVGEKWSAGAVQNGMAASERGADGPLSSNGGRAVFTPHNTESSCQSNCCLSCAVHFSCSLKRAFWRELTTDLKHVMGDEWTPCLIYQQFPRWLGVKLKNNRVKDISLKNQLWFVWLSSSVLRIQEKEGRRRNVNQAWQVFKMSISNSVI